MAEIWRTVYIVMCLVILKFFISLPLTTSLTSWLEGILESYSDQNFQFRGRDFHWTLVPGIARGLICRRGREAYRGALAPNVRLIFVDRTRCNLYNFVRLSRPLVVNFISLVDEPFFSELKAFNDMARRLSWSVDFVTVVVGCAVWRSKNDLQQLLDTSVTTCTRHCYCLQDRKTVATFLVDAGLCGDLVYDTSANEADIKYGASPERMYVIHRHFIVYAGDRGGSRNGYNVGEVWRFLWSFHRRQHQETSDLDSMASFPLDDPRHPLNLHKLAKEAHLDRDDSLVRLQQEEMDLSQLLSLRPGKSILKPYSGSSSKGGGAVRIKTVSQMVSASQDDLSSSASALNVLPGTEFSNTCLPGGPRSETEFPKTRLSGGPELGTQFPKTLGRPQLDNEFPRTWLPWGSQSETDLSKTSLPSGPQPNTKVHRTSLPGGPRSDTKVRKTSLPGGLKSDINVRKIPQPGGPQSDINVRKTSQPGGPQLDTSVRKTSLPEGSHSSRRRKSTKSSMPVSVKKSSR